MKNINNLFQEKFENFEVEPNQEVWDNIEIQLKEKKKKRIIPFWWKLSGVAALLTIGFFVFNTNSDKSNENTNSTIVNKENKENPSNNAIVNSQKNVNSSDKNNINSEKTTNYNDENSKQNSNVNNNVAVSKNNNIANEKSSLKNTNTVATVAYSDKKSNSVKTSNNKKSNYHKSNTTTNLIAENLKNNKKSSDENDKVSSNNSSDAINENKNIVNNVQNKLESLHSNDNSNPVIKKIDSLKIAMKEPNELEELLNEKEKKPVEQKLNRWQVTPNIAPIYFSSTGNGSPLDSRLESNSKNYNTNNQSYGLGVNYAVTKKWNVRTGVNAFSVNYVTNQILYYQDKNATSKIANLNPNVFGSLISIESLQNVNSVLGKFQEKYEGSINQKMGYIEVPFELSYKLINKKFGVNLIGGMSTLFLKQNEVFLEGNGLNVKIGEANNLNSVHFSTNFGLGMKYEFIKHFEARVEPVLKYQISTFSNDSGGFKPYIIGVYTGLSYSF